MLMFLVIGNGKTGSEVVKLIPKGQLLDVCTSKNPATLALMKQASCIILFVPTDTFESLKPLLIQSGKPVVIGTSNITLETDIPITAPWIIGSNFSVGMNLMFQIAKQSPKALINRVTISEEHHVTKQDSPSGTSVYLKNLFPGFDIDIAAKRTDDIHGIHTLVLNMSGESLTITHQSNNRQIYARGALLAAVNIHRYKKGIHNFEEIFDELRT